MRHRPVRLALLFLGFLGICSILLGLGAWGPTEAVLMKSPIWVHGLLGWGIWLSGIAGILGFIGIILWYRALWVPLAIGIIIYAGTQESTNQIWWMIHNLGMFFGVLSLIGFGIGLVTVYRNEKALIGAKTLPEYLHLVTAEPDIVARKKREIFGINQ